MDCSGGKETEEVNLQVTELYGSDRRLLGDILFALSCDKKSDISI